MRMIRKLQAQVAGRSQRRVNAMRRLLRWLRWQPREHLTQNRSDPNRSCSGSLNRYVLKAPSVSHELIRAELANLTMRET